MKDTCERCGRPIRQSNAHDKAIKLPIGRDDGQCLYFVHDFLGCDSGCCGHRFYVLDRGGDVAWSYLMLDEHDRDTLECEARELGRRLGVQVDWGACNYLDEA